MCGICGIISFKGPLARSNILERSSSLRRCGQDAKGGEHSDNSPDVWLGHTRFAVIDLIRDSDQPMSDPDTGCVIVFNGEIYNYLDISAELCAKGQVFRTRSVTEVILRAYAVWGSACLPRFRGIFAFAIWDPRTKTLFAARDPLGVKPFYYRREAGSFVFASEVRVLLKSGLVPARISPEGLASVLSYGSVQEPFSMIDGVLSLPAGSRLSVGPDGSFGMQTYWQPNFARLEIPESDAQELVTRTLEASIRMQMSADVPVGLFLSGGIDSCALASVMTRLFGDVHSFTVVCENPGLDEREQASANARRFGTQHRELVLTSEYVRSHLSAALDSYDEPGIDGLNTWFVANLAHEEGLKVALSGLGGDELFVGYDAFRRPRRLLRLQRIMRLLPSFIGRIPGALLKTEAARKLSATASFPLSAYFLCRQLMSSRTIAELMGTPGELYPHWMEACFSQLAAAPPSDDIINCISFWELSTYMRSTLLRDADQMCMANSLEIRVPLIDPVLTTLMLQIPGADKIDSVLSKHILVRAADVPSECAMRPKHGFDLPIDRFLRETCYKEAQSLFLAPPNDCLDRKALGKTWQLYLKGRYAWQRIWCIYVVLRWLQKYC